MKINQSSVAMAGSSSYSHYQKSEVTSVLVKPYQLEAAKKERLERLMKEKEQGVEVSISDESQSLLEDLMAEKKKAAKEQQKKLAENLLQAERSPHAPEISFRYQSEEDATLQTLKRILDMLRRIQKGDYSLVSASSMQKTSGWSADMHTSGSSTVSFGAGGLSVSQRSAFSLNQSAYAGSVVDLRSEPSVRAGVGTSWIRHTETNSFVMEQENATFSAQGMVKTADGREISFGVDLTMSRGFVGNVFSSKDEAVVLTDPLVINLDSETASVRDQKFFFDLDADGKAEEISQLGEGSGFLAYDKNGDGSINDGSELFGTKSGDGFADLAAYDADGNGWIDENDDIFGKLKVWTKDAEGNDRLLDLKEANVGAIYLGSADTRMHLKDAKTNHTDAVIQKTGVFLRETGEVGTIQHVDLAV